MASSFALKYEVSTKAGYTVCFFLDSFITIIVIYLA